jgi:hypothetical protein
MQLQFSAPKRGQRLESNTLSHMLHMWLISYGIPPEACKYAQMRYDVGRHAYNDYRTYSARRGVDPSALNMPTGEYIITVMRGTDYGYPYIVDSRGSAPPRRMLIDDVLLVLRNNAVDYRVDHRGQDVVEITIPASDTSNDWMYRRHLPPNKQEVKRERDPDKPKPKPPPTNRDEAAPNRPKVYTVSSPVRSDSVFYDAFMRKDAVLKSLKIDWAKALADVSVGQQLNSRRIKKK